MIISFPTQTAQNRNKILDVLLQNSLLTMDAKTVFKMLLILYRFRVSHSTLFVRSFDTFFFFLNLWFSFFDFSFVALSRYDILSGQGVPLVKIQHLKFNWKVHWKHVFILCTDTVIRQIHTSNKNRKNKIIPYETIHNRYSNKMRSDK